ncbi:MAG TPA: SIMPL domain-containing protein [Nitrososphaera sp.]|nr:SIMPL domain-containing protein [Nitrososphaera sp.]
MSEQKTKNKRMLALIAGILAMGMVGASIAGGQMLSASAQNPDDPMPVDIGCPTGAEVCEDVEGAVHSVVSTSGTATTKVQPDKFSVTVGVETNGTTAQEAADRNADAMDNVIAALRALGISEDQISTSNYSVYPVYEYRQPTEPCIMIYPPPPECQPKNEITGYRASNSVTVTLDADGQIDAGEVIDTAVGAGANTVQGAYYFLSQERQMEVQEGLIQQAIENARQRATIAASAVGMGIDRVKSINLNDVYFPIFSRGAGLEAADTQILPGQQDVTMTVTVVYVMSDGSSGNSQTNSGNESRDDMTIARNFILSKLPGLGIEIDDELDLHTDMVVHVSETEFHLDFGVVDTDGEVHDGHIELVNGEVTVATLDGNSIL